MVHDLLFHALLLLGMLCLSVILRWVWRQRAATGHATTQATRRSYANTLFPGLIHKPSCAICELGAQEQATPPPAAPSPMVTRRGCPRTLDTQHHFCPSPHCDYYGWRGFGNIRANGHPSGGRWRQLPCVACGTYFLETHGTPLHGTRVAPELVVWAVGALTEGLGIRAVARVFEVDPNTVLAWVIEAADHLEAFSRFRLHDVQIRQVQLDELYAVLSTVKVGQMTEAQAIERLERSPHWVWAAIDPQSKLLSLNLSHFVAHKHWGRCSTALSNERAAMP